LIRKTAFLITGTVAGVVGVLSYNPPQLNNSIASSNATTEPETTASPTSSSTPKTTPSKSPTTTSTKTKVADKPSQNSTQTQNSNNVVSTSGTFDGDTSQTRWGPVQVQITISEGKIADVSTLRYPNGDRRSLGISNQVIPWLQQEVLRVQSANISGISGATYTSNGFKASLASALQKAGL
jgi:uncharacterized protein with FMN-binding domain